MKAHEADFVADAQAPYDQTVKTLEEEVVESSDEESTLKRVISPETLTLGASPKKKMRGGQVKGKGRVRAKTIFVDPKDYKGDDFKELGELAENRFEISTLDMVEFFKLNRYDGCFGGILAELPYAN